MLDAPVPDAVYGKGTEIKGGSCCNGATGYGYPFVDGCCTSSYYGSGLWTGYYGRQCGRGCLHRGRCCGAKAASCYTPTVQYCDPCAQQPRRCGLFSRLHARHAGLCGGKGAGCCDTGCGYGFGYGSGMSYAMPYGMSSGCRLRQRHRDQG